MGRYGLSNVHIAPYEEGNIWNQEPERRRKLLPIKSKFKIGTRDQRNRNDPGSPLKSISKMVMPSPLGLAKGKHDYDKRESIKRREQNRDIARVMKAVNQR